MDVSRAILEVIFSKIPPELVIKQVVTPKYIKNVNLSKVMKTSIVQYLMEVLPGYSENEREHVFRILDQQIGADSKKSIFSIIKKFTKTVLVEYDYKSFCRFEELMRWRMISHQLEQDLLVTAFLAVNDLESSRKRTCFTWECVIKTDNIRLHNMLDEGLAENHFHLKGSALYFHLTWISLMNRVSNRKVEYAKSGITRNKLTKEISFNETMQKQSIEELVIKAAVIRSMLFEVCINNNEEVLEKEESIKWLNAPLEMLQLHCKDIDIKLQEIRDTYGFKIERKISSDIVDYAITKEKLTMDNNNYKLILYGERKLMYDCFKRIYNKETTLKDKRFENLFYIYILIKNKFRSEMVQNNNRVGFKNFSDYQDRKTVFLKNDPLLSEAVYYMAIQATKEDQNIRSLEVRIAPEETTSKTHNEIKKIDAAVRDTEHGFTEDATNLFIKNLTHNKNYLVNDERDISHFYVIHAIKGCDTDGERVLNNGFRAVLEMRDLKKRREAKNLAQQLITIRENRISSASRIFGIDAAANEIGCRPEIYAQAFRLLKQHTVSEQYNTLKKLGLEVQGEDGRLKLPGLKVTYHAGEDFLDIVDGLRTIDEAILYMNLSHGERIGHALALGIDAKEWYKFKGRTIVLPKHDYLDNVCWLLNKIDLLRISVSMNSRMFLEREYQTYYEEIYDFEKNDYFHVNYRDYYNAWMLRGDAPNLYETGEFVKGTEISFWDRCGINDRIDSEHKLRSNKMITRLYFRYHYDFDVRQKGLKSIDIKVDEEYINIVELVQKAMQRELRNKGIGIETNPSSNYLIGTFKRYDKHPIIKFFNLGLTYDNEQLKECEQLFVSINTDDQGVFGTYLENEYALLALALNKAKNDEGENLYNQEMIYDWLNKIRQMGLQQSFYTRQS